MRRASILPKIFLRDRPQICCQLIEKLKLPLLRTFNVRRKGCIYIFVVTITTRQQNKPQTVHTETAKCASLQTRTDENKRYDVFMSLEPKCTSTVCTKIT
jgi:hypothetical protein